MITNGHLEDPRDQGFFMPGEWAEHACCWMAWPARESLWPDINAADQDYANVANTIARFEPVKMLVAAHRLESAKALLGENVEIIEMRIDDSWARDSGPNFLVGGDSLAGSTWTFNAWGQKYDPYDQDALMGARILERVGARQYTSPLVAEGGGITVDGEGTVITTESCFLNENRNPGLSREDVEAELCRTLGAEKVIRYRVTRTKQKPTATSTELQLSSSPDAYLSKSTGTRHIRMLWWGRRTPRRLKTRSMRWVESSNSSLFRKAFTTRTSTPILLTAQ